MLRIKVNRTTFLKSLQTVQKAISDNKIRPLISGVYIEARGKVIFMRGTDLELTINSFIEGEIEEDGEIVFSYQLIEEYLKEIKEENISIIEQEGKILIETTSSSSEFSIYDSTEYPMIKNLDEGTEYYLSKEMFLVGLEKTRVAASVSSENLAVNCIRLELENKKMKMIASDTYRMVYFEEMIEGEGIPETAIKVSIPLKTVDALIKVLKMSEGESLNLRQEGSQIFFTLGATSVLSRVIDLAFPDYNSILSGANYDKKVLSRTSDFISVLKRVLVFVKNNTEAKNSGIFDFIGNKLILKGISEYAKVKEELDTLKDGEDLKISLNVKFLLDFLNHLDSDNVEVNLFNSGSPVLLKAEGSDKFVYLTMPLALREE